MNFILVLSTAANLEQAETIAEALVREHHVACVNIVPAIRSIYWWNESVQKDNEVLLIMKTAKEQFETVEKLIRSLHSYDVPEVISVALDNGSDGYLKWLESSLNS